MKKLLFLTFLLLIPLASSLDFYPKDITIYTNKDWFMVKLMIYNNETDVVTIKYDRTTYTLLPKHAKLFIFNLTFGEDLAFYANGRRITVPIEWKRGLGRQEPPVTGITSIGWGEEIEPQLRREEKIEPIKPSNTGKSAKSSFIQYLFVGLAIAGIFVIAWVLKTYFIV